MKKFGRKNGVGLRGWGKVVTKKDFGLEDRNKRWSIYTLCSKKLGIGFEGERMSKIKQDLELDYGDLRTDSYL